MAFDSTPISCRVNQRATKVTVCWLNNVQTVLATKETLLKTSEILYVLKRKTKGGENVSFFFLNLRRGLATLLIDSYEQIYDATTTT